MNRRMHITPDLPEPTQVELEQHRKLIKKQYDIELPNADLVKLVNLINELQWWQKADSTPGSTHQFSDEQLGDLVGFLEQASRESEPKVDVRNQANSILSHVPKNEMQRISYEIRGILLEHMSVPYDPAVVEKTIELLKVHYKVTLTDEQLEQVIPFLTKKLWYEMGFDSSLEECLDDLILYSKKVKRGERIKDAILHDAIRQALDLIVSNLTDREFERFYT